MKKLLVFVVILAMLLPLSATAFGAEGSGTGNIASYDSVAKAGRLISSGIIQQAIEADNYLYWNFYISADTNALTAYGYRYADALYNMDFMRAVNFETITKDDAKAVLEDFLCAYTLQNQEKYDNLADIEGLLAFLGNGTKAAQELVKAGVTLNGYDEESLQAVIDYLAPWKEKLERCVQKGDIDDTTMAWILGGELQRTTDSLNLTETFDTLCSASSMLANGIEIVSYINDLDERVQTLNTLKYAAEDGQHILLLLSQTSLDGNIRSAAVELRKALITYASASLGELALMAVGDTTADYAADHVMEAIESLSIKAIRDSGMKGIATGAAIGIDAGVAVSNILFNTGDTLQQVNKIRVLALVSCEVSSKLADAMTKFVMAYDDLDKKESSAREIVFCLPVLLLARELGEQQFYNMMKSQQDGLAAQLLALFNRPETGLEDWYASITAFIDSLQTQVEAIINGSANTGSTPDDPSTGGTDDTATENLRHYLALFNGITPFDDPNQIDKGTIVAMMAYTSGADWNSLTEEEKQILADYNYENFAHLSDIQATAQRLINPDVILPAEYDYQSNVVMGYGDGWVEELQGVGWNGHGLGSEFNENILLGMTQNSSGQYVVDVVEITVVPDEEYLSTHGVIYQDGREIGSADRDDPEGDFTYSYSVPLESLPSFRYVVQPYDANEYFGLMVISKTAN